MRILQAESPQYVRRIMHDIRVDPYGIEIMLPKALAYLIRINSISNITANILKQEMLSLGGDVAVSRDALTGKSRKTDCLLIANLSQLSRLRQKLSKQPFGLDRLAKDLSETLTNYERHNFIFNAGRYKLDLASRTHIMGIVNLTPDSFSGDGLYKFTAARIIGIVEKMVEDGADIIDVGGQSSRPGARAVSVKEELSRTIPVIKILSKKIKLPISIDTCKPEVAKASLDNGACIVNDITGLRNPKMAALVAKYKAGVVIMHMKGTSSSMQRNPVYKSVIEEITGFLDKAINRAVCAGIDKEKIIIDPGIGFGKTVEHNLTILKRLKEFKILGRPLLVGPSRKSFIGKISNIDLPQQRISGSVSACVLAVANGANLLRVHDVKEVKQALAVADRINRI